MKLDILKEEYCKLADEKEQFKREKQYHAWEEQKREQKKDGAFAPPLLVS